MVAFAIVVAEGMERRDSLQCILEVETQDWVQWIGVRGEGKGTTEKNFYIIFSTMKWRVVQFSELKEDWKQNRCVWVGAGSRELCFGHVAFEKWRCQVALGVHAGRAQSRGQGWTPMASHQQTVAF